jgi:hypothetical protein
VLPSSALFTAVSLPLDPFETYEENEVLLTLKCQTRVEVDRHFSFKSKFYRIVPRRALSGVSDHSA